LSTVTQPPDVPVVGAVSGTTIASVETRCMCAAVTFVSPVTVSV
jgi:hypothetical protein